MKEGEVLIYGGTILIMVLLLVSIPTFVGMFNVAPRSVIMQPTTEHQDMTYAPHYVKIHIVPEKEGIKVMAIPEKEGAVLSGLTDSNSEVVFEMVSFWKYNLIIGFNFPPCQYYIIPRESEYSVRC
jgi:hypothetical protein